MMRQLVFVSVLGGVIVGCAPDRPNTEYHKNASNDDCYQCHVLDAGPNPPSDHLDGIEVNKKHKDCKDCHKLE